MKYFEKAKQSEIENKNIIEGGLEKERVCIKKGGFTFSVCREDMVRVWFNIGKTKHFEIYKMLETEDDDNLKLILSEIKSKNTNKVFYMPSNRVHITGSLGNSTVDFNEVDGKYKIDRSQFGLNIWEKLVEAPKLEDELNNLKQSKGYKACKEWINEMDGREYFEEIKNREEIVEEESAKVETDALSINEEKGTLETIIQEIGA